MINQSIEGEPTQHVQKSKKRSRSANAIAKLSFTKEGETQSSLSTVLGITNSMVGSVCLVVPYVFMEKGIISCTLVMVFLGFVQYKTCTLLIVHQKPNEDDTEDTIKRILGKKWTTAFRLGSGSLMFIVEIIYFQLINLTMYPVMTFIFDKCGYENYSEDSDKIVFDKYSQQTQALIIFLPLSAILLFKDIDKIIKLAHYGVVAIICYGLYIFYLFFDNLSNDEFYDEEVKLFTWDISAPAGQFALAFMVHNAIGQLTKKNRIKENNQRDVGFAYMNAAIIYGSIGVFGALGILGKIPSNDKPQTVLDFFPKGNISIFIIELMFLIHLVTAFPIFNFISKLQILEAIYGKKEFPPLVFWGYSVILMTCCLTVQLLNINVGFVIAFDGAVCGFLLIYIIPIAIHMKCYYGQQNKTTDETSLLSDHNLCVKHDQIGRVHKVVRFIFYGLIIAVGLYNLILQFQELYSMFT